MTKGPDLNDRHRRGFKVVPDFPTGDGVNDDDGKGPGGRSQADKLVKMCADLRIVRSMTGESFVVVDPPVVMPLRSRAFRTWLSATFWEAQHTAPSNGAIDSATNTLEGRAHKAEQVPIFVRAGEAEGCTFLDLHHAVVRISAKGWFIDANPPVLFWRPQSALPLPMPVRGGDIKLLRQFVRVDDNDWALILMFMIAALTPMTHGAFPILMIHGIAGTAKTASTLAIRDLIDPAKSGARRPPRETRDLVSAAFNCWVVALDNVSALSQELSDDLCNLVSVGGFDQRALHTNYEQALASVKRPVILNGIVDFATKPDLLSRGLRVNLHPLSDGERELEVDLAKLYKEAQPLMLGALLDGAVASHRASGRASRRRLADSERLAVAAETTFGLEAGSTARALDSLEGDRVEVSLEAWSVWPELEKFLNVQRGKWDGTATELLDALNRAAPTAHNKPGWPRGSNALSGQINQHFADLDASGVEVIRPPRSDRRKKIVLRLKEPPLDDDDFIDR